MRLIKYPDLTKDRRVQLSLTEQFEDYAFSIESSELLHPGEFAEFDGYRYRGCEMLNRTLASTSKCLVNEGRVKGSC